MIQLISVVERLVVFLVLIIDSCSVYVCGRVLFFKGDISWQ